MARGGLLLQWPWGRAEGPGQNLLVSEEWVLSAALSLFLDLLGVLEGALCLCQQDIPSDQAASLSLPGSLGCSFLGLLVFLPYSPGQTLLECQADPVECHQPIG